VTTRDASEVEHVGLLSSRPAREAVLRRGSRGELREEVQRQTFKKE
jgi:hypothetical protein